MLVKDFYRVKQMEAEKGSIKALVELNPEHTVYKGHFPGQPIVPGVLQIQIIKEVLENAVSHVLIFEQIKSAKYLQPIDPVNVPIFEVAIEHNLIEENLYKLNALIRANEVIFTRIKALASIKK